MELLSDDVNLGSAQVTLLEIFFLVITNRVVLFTVINIGFQSYILIEVFAWNFGPIFFFSEKAINFNLYNNYAI